MTKATSALDRWPQRRARPPSRLRTDRDLTDKRDPGPAARHAIAVL